MILFWYILDIEIKEIRLFIDRVKKNIDIIEEFFFNKKINIGGIWISDWFF